MPALSNASRNHKGIRQSARQFPAVNEYILAYYRSSTTADLVSTLRAPRSDSSAHIIDKLLTAWRDRLRELSGATHRSPAHRRPTLQFAPCSEGAARGN